MNEICFLQVREDLCLAQEAYQFFRYKYKNRYGEDGPPYPDVFKKESWNRTKK